MLNYRRRDSTSFHIFHWHRNHKRRKSEASETASAAAARSASSVPTSVASGNNEQSDASHKRSAIPKKDRLKFNSDGTVSVPAHRTYEVDKQRIKNHQQPTKGSGYAYDAVMLNKKKRARLKHNYEPNSASAEIRASDRQTSGSYIPEDKRVRQSSAAASSASKPVITSSVSSDSISASAKAVSCKPAKVQSKGTSNAGDQPRLSANSSSTDNSSNINAKSASSNSIQSSSAAKVSASPKPAVSSNSAKVDLSPSDDLNFDKDIDAADHGTDDFVNKIMAKMRRDAAKEGKKLGADTNEQSDDQHFDNDDDFQSSLSKLTKKADKVNHLHTHVDMNSILDSAKKAGMKQAKEMTKKRFKAPSASHSSVSSSASVLSAKATSHSASAKSANHTSKASSSAAKSSSASSRSSKVNSIAAESGMTSAQRSTAIFNYKSNSLARKSKANANALKAQIDHFKRMQQQRDTEQHKEQQTIQSSAANANQQSQAASQASQAQQSNAVQGNRTLTAVTNVRIHSTTEFSNSNDETVGHLDKGQQVEVIALTHSANGTARYEVVFDHRTGFVTANANFVSLGRLSDKNGVLYTSKAASYESQIASYKAEINSYDERLEDHNEALSMANKKAHAASLAAEQQLKSYNASHQKTLNSCSADKSLAVSAADSRASESVSAAKSSANSVTASIASKASSQAVMTKIGTSLAMKKAKNASQDTVKVLTKQMSQSASKYRSEISAANFKITELRERSKDNRSNIAKVISSKRSLKKALVRLFKAESRLKAVSKKNNQLQVAQTYNTDIIKTMSNLGIKYHATQKRLQQANERIRELTRYRDQHSQQDTHTAYQLQVEQSRGREMKAALHQEYDEILKTKQKNEILQKTIRSIKSTVHKDIDNVRKAANRQAMKTIQEFKDAQDKPTPDPKLEKMPYEQAKHINQMPSGYNYGDGVDETDPDQPPKAPGVTPQPESSANAKPKQRKPASKPKQKPKAKPKKRRNRFANILSQYKPSHHAFDSRTKQSSDLHRKAVRDTVDDAKQMQKNDPSDVELHHNDSDLTRTKLNGDNTKSNKSSHGFGGFRSLFQPSYYRPDDFTTGKRLKVRRDITNTDSDSKKISFYKGQILDPIGTIPDGDKIRFLLASGRSITANKKDVQLIN